MLHLREFFFYNDDSEIDWVEQYDGNGNLTSKRFYKYLDSKLVKVESYDQSENLTGYTIFDFNCKENNR